MHKIYSRTQIKSWDAYTIANEPIASIDLMERAANEIAKVILNDFEKIKNFEIYCGQGNNGGDGLAVARILAFNKKNIKVHIVGEKEIGTPDFELNLQRLKSIETVTVKTIKHKSDLCAAIDGTIIIDAIIGTGLKGATNGLIKETIDFINALKSPIVAIDVPSGLLCDEPLAANTSVVRATTTLTFQCLKLAFLFSENQQYCGKVRMLNIGLSPAFEDLEKTKNYYASKESVREMIPRRNMFSHKGNNGHALLLCGSEGKFGAALLAAKACLRSGAGLLTVHSAGNLELALNSFLPSAMFSSDISKVNISQLPDLRRYTAVAFGCGVGFEKESCQALKLLIQQCNVPIVLDADALTILSENKTWLSFLPPGTILTPHPKEFERLFGKWNNGFERLQMQKEYSEKYNCYIVFKGAYTCVSAPNGICYFNTTGNPGMAKGGSGDALTGVITALLAQGLPMVDACIARVYIHGLAGDYAKQGFGELSMLPEDLIEHLGAAFNSINE